MIKTALIYKHGETHFRKIVFPILGFNFQKDDLDSNLQKMRIRTRINDKVVLIIKIQVPFFAVDFPNFDIVHGTKIRNFTEFGS